MKHQLGMSEVLLSSGSMGQGQVPHCHWVVSCGGKVSGERIKPEQLPTWDRLRDTTGAPRQIQGEIPKVFLQAFRRQPEPWGLHSGTSADPSR